MQSPIQFRTIVLPRAEAPERNRFLPTAKERDLQQVANLRLTSELALDLA